MRAHYRAHTSSAHYLAHHAPKQVKDNHVASLAERILTKQCVVQANFTAPSQSPSAAEVLNICVVPIAQIHMCTILSLSDNSMC